MTPRGDRICIPFCPSWSVYPFLKCICWDYWGLKSNIIQESGVVAGLMTVAAVLFILLVTKFMWT